jgi:magnesium-transporting ATPase (P-type)
MFTATKWELIEPQGVPEEENTDTFDLTYVQPTSKKIKIFQLRQFPFSSDEARQTIVVQTVTEDGTKELVTFMKGAPERIAMICDQSSVPLNFEQILNELSAKGHRILGNDAKN